MTDDPELVLVPKQRLAQLEADVAALQEAVLRIAARIDGADAEGDPLFAKFLSFRQRARAAEARLEVPWRTS